MRFNDTVALVTGASRGIGRATALRLAAEGAIVVVNHPPGDEEKAGQVVAEVAAGGGRAVAICADISKSAEVQSMIDRTVAELGAIQILVNNAGICPMHSFLEMPEALWDQVQAINLKGAFLCSQAVAKLLVERKLPGRFVFVSSISAWVGGALQTHYTPSKAGVSSLMKSLAVALAPHGIHCNAVLPGTILTDINRELLAEGAPLKKHLSARIPLGRLGQPEDIASVIAFLCSEDSRYMTGSEVLVDGGMFVNLQ